MLLPALTGAVISSRGWAQTTFEKLRRFPLLPSSSLSFPVTLKSTVCSPTFTLKSSRTGSLGFPLIQYITSTSASKHRSCCSQFQPLWFRQDLTKQRTPPNFVTFIPKWCPLQINFLQSSPWTDIKTYAIQSSIQMFVLQIYYPAMRNSRLHQSCLQSFSSKVATPKQNCK